MKIADIIILVLLLLWGVVAVRSMSRQKGCGGCHGCNGNCRTGSCPNVNAKKHKQTQDKHED